MNEYYVPGFTGYLQRSVLGDVGTPESLPATVDPLTGELVYYTPPAQQPVVPQPSYYAPPTERPIYSEPVSLPDLVSIGAGTPSYYAPPTEQPVMAEAMPTAYGLPTEQPVVAEPAEAAPIDLGGWSLENFQKQFMRGDPAQADATNKWLAAQAAQGREYVYDPLDNVAHQIAMNSLVPMGGPDYSSFDPNDPTSSMAEIFRFDIGQQKGTAPAAFRTGQNFVLTDASGKNVLGRASTPEEMRALIEAANAKQYGWHLYRGDEQGNYTPGTQLFGESDPRVGGALGALVNIGLPLAMSFIPGVGWLGSAALAGAGSTAGGLLTGKTLEDALKSGAITTATAGLLKGTGLDQTIGNAIGKVPGVGDALRTVGGAFAPNAAQAVGDEIVVNAATSAANNLASPIISNILGQVGSLPANQFQPAEGGLDSSPAAQPEDPIVVNAARPAPAPAPAPAPVPVGGLEAAFDAAFPRDQIVVEAQRPAPPPEPAAPPLPVYVPPSGGPATQPIDEIVVSKRNEPISTPGGALGSVVANYPSLSAPTTTPTTPAETPDNRLRDIVDYLRLAGLGIGALGSLFGGGGGSQNNFRVPGGMGGLSPTFGARLPTANLPGLTGGTAAAPRTAANLGTQGLRTPQDYYRYGYGPEQSFFNYVPEGEKNTSTAYTGYAKGGFAVEGPGDGRGDKIPAMLSDGEYVIDAETVALLGNGSNKAGANMLDQFRVNVRKHKGRELTRGQFSKNAKRPEQYLAGGRA